MMLTPPSVPPNVISAVRSRWPERAGEWTRRVETELLELCARYRATPRRVLPARYGFVVAVDTVHGGLVMRSSADPNGPNQSRVAIALADLGVAPTVHEAIDTDISTWMILDEVQPATPLAEANVTDATVESLATTLLAMHGQPAPVPGMPSVHDWLRERLESVQSTDLPPGVDQAPDAVRRAALVVLDDLGGDATSQLCHGDMSPLNVLASGTNEWTLIDPRGMSGEVSYDAAVLGLKIARNGPATLIAVRLAKAAGLDADRTLAWVSVADAARV